MALKSMPYWNGDNDTKTAANRHFQFANRLSSFRGAMFP